jgi:hypothetical protein
MADDAGGAIRRPEGTTGAGPQRARDVRDNARRGGCAGGGAAWGDVDNAGIVALRGRTRWARPRHPRRRREGG